MTLRALIIGFLAALFIAGFGFVNDWVFLLESFNNGHLMAIIVVGTMFVFVVAANPLLHRIKPSFALQPKELAVIVGLMMIACSIPGRGMFEQFTQTVTLPHHWHKLEPGWQRQKLMNTIPEDAYVDVYKKADDPSAILNDDGSVDRSNPLNHDQDTYERVVNRYHMGPSQTATSDLSVSAFLNSVPWANWKAPLVTWMPLILLMALSTICLTLVVHRQWAHHELLSYPIAEFTAVMVDREEGKAYGKLLANRLFWIGFGIVLFIRVLNGLHKWFPENLVSIPLSWGMPELKELIPTIKSTPPYNGGFLTRIYIFPLVVAFSFFLRSEISLTFGLSHILWCFFAMPMVLYGVDLNTDYDIGGWMGWHRAGSYSAFSLMIIYFGRNYFLKLTKGAVGMKPPEGEEPVQGIWAFRIFVLATLGMIGIIINMGCSWPVAILTVLLILQTYMIVARIGAETGLFFIQPGWQPFGALMPFFGAYAMGPEGIMISALVCCVLCIDQSQALMPYLVNALKITERFKVSVTTFSKASFVTYAAGSIVAVVIILGCAYSIGINHSWFAYKRVPTIPFRAASPHVTRLIAQENLDASRALSGFERIINIRPTKAFMGAFGTGFFFVMVFAFLRLRFSKFPLHPLLFLVWGTFPLSVMFQSFLLGWFAKIMVQKYGGNAMVQKLKPLAFGIVAAEVIGALIFMIAGAIYYIATGDVPKSYSYFPR